MRTPNTPFVFLDISGHNGSSGLLFSNPDEIITTRDVSEIETCFEKIEFHRSNGAYLAGFFSYEAGYLFESKLEELLPERRETPLIWFGVFTQREELTQKEIDKWLAENGSASCEIGKISPSLSKAQYEKKFSAIQNYISDGDIYQANLTFKGRFTYEGSAFSLYHLLRRGQQTAYGGMIETGKQTFLSLSPELFFTHQDGELTCCPMKGTAKRGVTNTQDAKIKDWLKSDQKSQAENLMIVDLMRNDMSRISKPGSVKVSNLYEVETYPTLHQMTSSITSQLQENISIRDIIKNIFPCGSVTGAPKLRAMEIIHELEDTPRGIYTGAMGYIAPKSDIRFNVAIRTLKLDQNSGEIGIGSGLVADSRPQEEYDECLLKMRFLQHPQPHFDLLETLKWDKTEGYVLLEFHLDRLQKSANYFDFPFKRNSILESLSDFAASFPNDDQRVRLLLSKQGELSLTHTSLPPQGTKTWQFVVSNKRMNSTNPYLFHKTTYRQFYDEEREVQKSRTKCDEVVFLNEKGELTEGSFTNIFIRKKGRLFTPARTCGLLDGTFRRHLLERKNDPASEAILKLDDIEEADEIYLGNSVRGLIPAKLMVELTPA